MLDSQRLKKVIRGIRAEKRKISQARDKLRASISEVEDICDDCDDAVEDLDRALDTLSKYL